MKPVTLCVTTFNRQDLLGRCLFTALRGTLTPSRIVIVDQRGARKSIEELLASSDVPYEIVDLGDKRGCEALAVNWYLTNVPEERVIAHDDVQFGRASLETFVAAKGAFLIDEEQGIITYRDEAVQAVGLYDVDMSPNHFRYVDADYEERLAEVGIEPTVVKCGVRHLPGGTLRGYSQAEIDDHIRRFGLADAFYRKKWGRELTPGASTIGRSNWRKENWPKGNKGRAA